MLLRILFTYLLLCSCSLFSQELPPVISFPTEQYQGGSQNWGISQDENGFIYVANNEGLLEFNGREWRLYPSPNESIVRSVKALDGKVYTGNYMDFGCWTRSASGDLEYASLSRQVSSSIRPDEHFWNIIGYEDYLIFQSLDQLFLYNPKDGDIEVISPERGLTKIFSTAVGLYFTDQFNQLYELLGGAVRPIITADDVPVPIVHLWLEGNALFVQSAGDGCFLVQDGRLIPQARHAFLAGRQLYSATSLQQGGAAFGTIANGIYIVDAAGRLQYHLDQVDGVTNNTILSLFEDAERNLWAGTDNGISCLNLASPFRMFTDNTGQLGTIHASAVHRESLYLGSNQGLFVKSLYNNDLPKLIPGTRGQVWSLFEHQGSLFCGHDLGTFLISDRKASSVFSAGGTWMFQPVPGRPELLLQGNYAGLSVLERRGDSWSFRNEVAGFDYSARFLAMLTGQEVYISHEYRGVYGVRLDPDYRRVEEQQLYAHPAKGKNAGLTAFQDSIFYYSREGIFSLRDFTSGFRRSPELNADLEASSYVSGKMTPEDDRLWFFTQDGISYFRRGALNDGLLRQRIPVPLGLINVKSGYENVTKLAKDSVLLGTSNGYLIMALPSLPTHEHKVLLTEAKASPAEGDPLSLNLRAGGSIPFRAHNLAFKVTVPSFGKFFVPRFHYRLTGYKDNWSAWSEEASIRFPELPPGNYTLEVQSLLGQTVSENTLGFPFKILRPWYASYPAIFLYFLAGILLVYLLHRAYTRYYQKKVQEQWAESQRLISAQQREAALAMSQVANEQLQLDIKSKNREVALSTMNLVKKNELLQQIKENLLDQQHPEKNIREVIQTINQNIDEAETWSLFKDAFENADQDFFKKIKDLHPELTPNDLKLCAYLRLNLSSKEIAPLLNISSKSVEVKRYRLRKKMGLEHEDGLVEYILGM